MAESRSTREVCLEITARLDRHAVEALRLEIQRLAKRYDIELRELRIERPEETRSP